MDVAPGGTWNHRGTNGDCVMTLFPPRQEDQKMPGIWEEIARQSILANKVLCFGTYQARLSLCYGIPER